MDPNSIETNQSSTKTTLSWSRLKPKTKLSIAFALLFLVALPLTIFASQLNSDTRSRASYSPTLKRFVPSPTPIMTCNTTINPPRNCPSGYYCDYSTSGPITRPADNTSPKSDMYPSTRPILGKNGVCRPHKPTSTPSPVPSNIITWKSDRLSLSMSDFFIVMDNTIYHPTPATTFEISPTSTDKNGINPTNSIDVYWTENNNRVRATIKINVTNKTFRIAEFYFYPTNNISNFLVFTTSPTINNVTNPNTQETIISSLSLGSTNITSNSPNTPKGYLSFSNLKINSTLPVVINPTMSIPEKPPYPTYTTKSATPKESTAEPYYPNR